MNKIFQKRINNNELVSNNETLFFFKNELEGSKGTLFYPTYLDSWNRGSIKTINGIIKKITGYDGNIKITFHDNHSFTLKADKEYQCSLEYGDIEELPKIRLTDGDVTTIYEVLSIFHDNETLVKIDSEITKRDDKVLTQMFSKNGAYFTIEIDDIVYRVTIYNPNTDSDKVFELPYEDDLKEALLSFNRDTSLNEIISVLEQYLGSLDKYPRIEATRRIEEKGELPKTTDEFIVKNGSLHKYMQTKKVGSKNYVVTIEDDKISHSIENLSFDDIVKPDDELVEKGMQYVKKYPKK